MVQAGGAPVVASAPTACQVQCAGCRRILNVPSGILNFQCPKCKLPQVLPPQLRSQGLARGIDNTKIQLPCANCRAVLNVPPGLTRFVCPQCRVELAVDPVKLAAYMSSLSQLNALGNGQGAPPTVSAGGLPGSLAMDAMDDTGWNNKPLQGANGFSMEEINEVRSAASFCGAVIV
jgi:LSD1 subclass zinc finger protein